MSRRPHPIAAWLALGALASLGALAGACGRTSPLGEDEVVSLRLEPATARLYLGQPLQLLAEARRASGRLEDVSQSPELAVRLTAGAGIELEPGLALRATAPGQARVLARYQGREARCELEVLDAGLEALLVAPFRAELELGATQQLTVIGVLDSGERVDLSAGATGTTYHADRPRVVALTRDGLAFALERGVARVEVRHADLAAVAELVVDGGQVEVDRIELRPEEIELEVGDSLSVQVIGHLTDGGQADLTADPEVFYTSADEAVAAFQAPGELEAFGPGSTEVTAVYRALYSTATVRVRPAEAPSAVEVEPGAALLQPGDVLQLAAWASYADGARVEVSEEAVWVSSAPQVVRVDARGLATALEEGEARISALYQGLTGNATLRVDARALVELHILDAEPLRLEVGQSSWLHVEGLFDDGGREDLGAASSGTVYASADPGTAVVSPDGLVTGVGPGTTTLRAENTGLADTLQVEVGGPRLVALHVEPPALSVAEGDTARVAVMGLYADGLERDVTAAATFTSHAPEVVSVLGPGELLAHRLGQARVSAALAGHSADCRVTVVEGQVVALRVEPNQAELQLGEQLQLRVVATYTGGAEREVQDRAAFRSSDLAVAVVLPGGLVLAQGAGHADVFATFAGMTVVAYVDVREWTLVDYWLEPDAVRLPVGDQAPLRAWGLTDTGLQVDLTSESSFRSDDPGVASVSPLAVVLGVAPGLTRVRADYAGLAQAAATVEVLEAAHPWPVLLSLQPAALLVGSGAASVLLMGTDFHPSSRARLDGQEQATTFVSTGELRMSVPAGVTALAGLHQVDVVTPAPGGGTSAALALSVLAAPRLTSLSPDSGLQGHAVRVVARGSGLVGCSVSVANPGVSPSGISVTPDGTQLSVTLSVAAGAAPGPTTLDLQNAVGSASARFTVIQDAPLPDLTIGPGEIVFLSGVQSYRNITIGTGARVFGVGTRPLQLLATGDVIVRGEIDVSGFAGEDGFYNPADGGGAGPGGGGGGGGADGNAAEPAAGGAGAPAGSPAGGAAGAGTPGGAGGGQGGGQGAAGGCGQAGGGGGFGGGGGGGGGDAGVGAGGAGGAANPAGSTYGGGPGGGGGSTCGQNSGGGGGGGGGVLVLATTGGSLLVDGALRADGGPGGDGFTGTGGGGGGAGGRITLTTAGGAITVRDTLSVRGGDGGRADAGDAGGGGGGGRLALDPGGGPLDDDLGFYDVAGGAGGVSRDQGFDGEPGEPGLVDLAP